MTLSQPSKKTVLHVGCGAPAPNKLPKPFRNGDWREIRFDIDPNVKPDVVGMSAFLTTTMPMFKVNIEAIEKAGLRDDVVIMVGGAPVTQEYADKCGADGYSADAAGATKRAKELLAARKPVAA